MRAVMKAPLQACQLHGGGKELRMNSYELLKPDAGGSGVWSCGECHKVHSGATQAGKPASDSNKTSAARCCAPRNCTYCGKTTERDQNGQFQWAHEECMPKHEPVASHSSMANPYARLLYKKMSDISENCHFAGWISDNEYSLWEIFHGDRPGYGWGSLSHEDLEELQVLSKHAEGWIWTGPAEEHTPQLVTFAQWESIRAARGKVTIDHGFEEAE
jgi:hypothetical protein